ncbi:MAG: hypothetical protein JNN00_15540 [Chitinophagaceae bacterium]|nr:hypothetical protein [Chitinophagaceae bacterium]
MRYFPLVGALLILLACRSKERIEISFPNGGVNYSSDVETLGENFYQYPFKDSLSYWDSVTEAYWGPIFFSSFEESNLSLHSPAENTFRLIYETSLGHYASIIILTQDQVVVKAIRSGFLYEHLGDSLLTETERWHFELLNLGMIKPSYRDKYFDSLTNAMPTLRNPAYHLYLFRKGWYRKNKEFTYKTWRKRLSREKYLYFVNKLNASEFWNVGRSPLCTNGDMDGFGFLLEAATLKKYQTVGFTSCPELPLLNQFCRELMRFSGLVDAKKEWIDKLSSETKRKQEAN